MKAQSNSSILAVSVAALSLAVGLFTYSVLSLIDLFPVRGELVKTEAIVVTIEKYIHDYDEEGEAEYARRALVQFETPENTETVTVTWGFDLWCEGMDVTVWYDTADHTHVHSLLAVVCGIGGIPVSIALTVTGILGLLLLLKQKSIKKKELLDIKDITSA